MDRFYIRKTGVGDKKDVHFFNNVLIYMCWVIVTSNRFADIRTQRELRPQKCGRFFILDVKEYAIQTWQNIKSCNIYVQNGIIKINRYLSKYIIILL